MRLLGRQLRQPTLFEEKEKSAFETRIFRLAEICSRLSVTDAELREWRNVGFLSFDPESVWPYERWMCAEIAFVRDLMRVEFSLNAVRALLSSLKTPHAYSHQDICYDFRTRRWRQHVSAEDFLGASVDAPEHLEHSLFRAMEALGRFGRSEELRRIREFIDRTLQSIAEDE